MAARGSGHLAARLKLLRRRGAPLSPVKTRAWRPNPLGRRSVARAGRRPGEQGDQAQAALDLGSPLVSSPVDLSTKAPRT